MNIHIFAFLGKRSILYFSTFHTDQYLAVHMANQVTINIVELPNFTVYIRLFNTFFLDTFYFTHLLHFTL